MFYFFLSGLLACTSSSDFAPTEASTEMSVDLNKAVLYPTSVCTLLVEEIENGDEVMSLSPYQWLVRRGQENIFVDEHTQTESVLEADRVYDVQRQSTMQSLLTVDGDLLLLNSSDGTVLYSPINDVLPVPIQEVQLIDDTIWMLGAGRLFRWTEGRLSEVSLNEESNVRTMHRSNDGLAILIPHLEILQLQDGGPVISNSTSLLPLSMASTSSMGLYITEGASEIHRYHNGVWTQFEIEGVGEVLQLMSSTESDVLWVQGAESAVLYHRGEVCSLDPDVSGDWFDVDEIGRLIVGKDGVISRYSLEQPVAVVGMLPNEQVDITRELFFLPTVQESIIKFSVWVGTLRLDVNEESNSTLLNPDDFGQGTHSIRMVAERSDGVTITEFPFVIGELPESSWEDVEPIYLDNCTNCHHSSALIPLDTIDLWRQNIDLIIDEVSAQTMPLGMAPLTEEEVLVIRGWKQGGLQE